MGGRGEQVSKNKATGVEVGGGYWGPGESQQALCVCGPRAHIARCQLLCRLGV